MDGQQLNSGVISFVRHQMIVGIFQSEGSGPSLIRFMRFQIEGALLHKPADGQATTFPGRTYPTATVTGIPNAV